MELKKKWEAIMETRRRNMRRYIIAALAVIFTLAGAWWGFGSAPSFAGELKKTTFLVQGVTCGSCLSAIRGELFKKPGMVAMAADLNQGLLRIDHQPPLSEEAIVRTLADLGYPARAVPEGIELTGGEPMAKGCSGCGPNGCSATSSSWRELYRKIFGAQAR
jgi:copper chaperone